MKKKDKTLKQFIRDIRKEGIFSKSDMKDMEVFFGEHGRTLNFSLNFDYSPQRA